MGIPLLVVEHRALLNRLLGDGQIDPDGAISTGRSGLHRQLQGIQQTAGIAAGHINQVVGRCCG